MKILHKSVYYHLFNNLKSCPRNEAFHFYVPRIIFSYYTLHIAWKFWFLTCYLHFVFPLGTCTLLHELVLSS